ncbi:hypothetical protein AA16373_1159 [Komagataeibacter swingsii DSM 16373]|nr:hypothetical protein AA16373_1159 [Komagataeibacter swingsii DSM 16373]
MSIGAGPCRPSNPLIARYGVRNGVGTVCPLSIRADRHPECIARIRFSFLNDRKETAKGMPAVFTQSGTGRSDTGMDAGP